MIMMGDNTGNESGFEDLPSAYQVLGGDERFLTDPLDR